MTNEVQTEKKHKRRERKRVSDREGDKSGKKPAYKIYAMSFLFNDRQPYQRHFMAEFYLYLLSSFFSLHCK